MEQARAGSAGFTDYLFKPVEPSRIVETVEAHLAMGKRAAAERPRTGSKVLVVDDDPVNLKLLKIRLTRLGFEVDTAPDGMQALAHARKTPPDAIVSDVLMPRLDGFRLCAALKKDRRLGRVPIVLTSSAYQETEDRRLARAAGASAFVLRTPDFKAVIEALQDVLHRERPSRTPKAAGEADEDYVHRVIRQLERQVVRNGDLARRLALRETELSLIASLQGLDTADVDTVAEEILVRALDAAAVSRGAVYLVDHEGRLTFRAQLGYPNTDDEILQAFFGHADLLRTILERGELVQVPSPALPDDVAGALLDRSKTVGLVIAPILKGEDRLGVLVAGTGAKPLSEEWIDFVRNIGGQLGHAVVVTRAFARLGATEAKYRAIVDNALYGIFQATPDGRFITVNRALARILGYATPSEMLSTVGDLAARAYADPAHRAQFVRLLTETGVVSRFETRVRRKDASTAWVSISAQAVRDTAGDIRYVEGAVEDISERRQAEAATAALAEVSRALSKSIDPDVVGRLVTDSVCRLLGAQSAAVYRQETGSGDLVLITVSDLPPTGFQWSSRFAPNTGLAGLAVRERRPMAAPDVLHDPRIRYSPEVRETLAGRTARALLGVPLLVRERTFGALVVSAPTGRVFSDEEIALAQAFADQAGLALDNAHLVADLRARETRLQALLETSRQLTAIQPLDSLLSHIAAGCGRLVDASSVAFRLLEGDELVLHSTWGEVATERKRLRIGVSLSEWIAATGEPAMVRDLAVDPRLVPDPGEASGEVAQGAWMGVPVKIGDRLVGVLSVHTRREQGFSEEDLATATTFAAEAALALENAHLYEEVRSGRDFLESIARNSADTIVTTGVDGHINYASPGAEAMLGYRPDELQDRPAADLYAGGADEARAVTRRLETEQQITHYETTVRAKDGRLLDVDASISILREAGGARTGTISVIRDVTEHKRMEANLRQSEKLSAMGSLLAGVAHELNNPLAILGCHAQLLKQSAAELGLRDRATRIGEAVDRCSRIVRNFLALARQAPPERGRVDLNGLVREAVELLRYSLRVDGVEMALDLAPDLPLLWADGHQLQQVVINLGSNAHHALRQTSPPRRLTFTTRVDAGGAAALLRVADSGPGIPAAVRARIFEPFFTTKPVGQGTGLGLSLCQSIVADHGGAIEVTSEPGEGAVFSIRLPVEPLTASASEVKMAPPPASLPPCHILVVEDEPEVAELLAEVLASAGHTVETVGNGVQALERMAARSYDVILSDLRMPELDGPALYREAERRHPGLAKRFVFLSGDALSEEARMFLESVHAPHLGKPFSLAEVNRVLHHALTRARSSSARNS
jgi:two-component system NtrC family sensor kinase